MTPNSISNEPMGRLSSKACAQCRKVKMKCRLVLGSDKCERCIRKSMDCLFFQKKRGRKPKRHHMADQAPQRPDGDKATDQVIEANTNRDNWFRGDNGSSSFAANATNLPPLDAENNDLDPGFWESSEGLQPQCVLNKEANKGKYSLQNILSTGKGLDVGKSQDVQTQVGDDPISNGMVSYHVASSLFDGFMKSLNPFVCILDPVLHTFSYVRERSPFLLTVILAASTRAFNPAIHAELQNHSQRLFIDSFARNTKSTEVIQAIILSTYWKQPDDTRSWSTIGYCIRLCMELNWHKLGSAKDDDTKFLSELERRQKRDVERTWFVLFVYDRSMSLQTGKPWMIERSKFIESVNTWYKSPLATSNDATMAALVTLRLASADILEVFSPQRPASPMTHPYRVGALLKTLGAQITAWKKHWLLVLSNKEICHSFLVHFFSAHLSLLLYSFRLQASISSPIGASLVDTETFWITYNSALEMLELVSQPSLSPLLSFVHDSIHAMTAYAAAFLIKLLLLVNTAIRQEYEAQVIKTIEATNRVFAQQSTPPDFPCTLQAVFLSNVIHEYKKASQRRSMAAIEGGSINATQLSGTYNVGDPAHQSVQIPLRAYDRSTPDFLQRDLSIPQTLAETRQEDDNRRVHLNEAAQIHLNQGGGRNESGGSNPSSEMLRPMEDGPFPRNSYSEEQLYGDLFSDDQEWSTMFLNAGFDIDGGVFVPQ